MQIDAVWMLTDASSPDSWMQRAFRCLTERKAHAQQQPSCGAVALPAKTHGVVVDAYPHRVLQTLLAYCSIGDIYSTPADMLYVLIKSGVIQVNKDFCQGYLSTSLEDDETSAAAMQQTLNRMYCAARLLNAAASQQVVRKLLSHRLGLPSGQAGLLLTGSKTTPQFKQTLQKGTDGSDEGNKGKEDQDQQRRTRKDSSDREEKDELDSNDAGQILTRLVTLLSFMSYREFAAAVPSPKPSIGNLLSWLRRQKHPEQLQRSLAWWIEWETGASADSTQSATAWQQLYDVGMQLELINAEFHQGLLELAMHYRLQLMQAMEESPASTGRTKRRLDIVNVVNSALQTCGERLMYSVTPTGLVHRIIEKLQAADAVCMRGLFTPLEQQPGNPAPPAAISTPSVAAKPAPPKLLDLGAGSGALSAALFDALCAAGWPAELVEAEMLHVAEPDLTMQHLFSVAFPSFTPQCYPVEGAASSSKAGAAADGAVASGSSCRVSLPCNIGEIPPANIRTASSAVGRTSSTSKPAASSQVQVKLVPCYDAILSFLPHNPLYKGKSIISHLLACSAVDMLKQGGHAMLLLTNRWRCSKGLKGDYPGVRSKLSQHLGDVWDILTQQDSRSLLFRG